MSMVGRRENNQQKQYYRGNKLQFLSYKHGALLPMLRTEYRKTYGSTTAVSRSKVVLFNVIFEECLVVFVRNDGLACKTERGAFFPAGRLVQVHERKCCVILANFMNCRAVSDALSLEISLF